MVIVTPNKLLSMVTSAGSRLKQNHKRRMGMSLGQNSLNYLAPKSWLALAKLESLML